LLDHGGNGNSLEDLEKASM